MRKRLRKKLHLLEFRQDLFGVKYRLRVGVSANAAQDFLWRFLEEAIEANGLSCGGGGEGEVWEVYVSSAKRGSPTMAERAAVGDWLSRQSEVGEYSLGDLFDGWHGPEEAPYTDPAVGVHT